MAGSRTKPLVCSAPGASKPASVDSVSCGCSALKMYPWCMMTNLCLLNMGMATRNRHTCSVGISKR